MMLELNDFPPLFDLLDAHALWHGLTIPLVYAWWSFLMDEAAAAAASRNAKQW